MRATFKELVTYLAVTLGDFNRDIICRILLRAKQLDKENFNFDFARSFSKVTSSSFVSEFSFRDLSALEDRKERGNLVVPALKDSVRKTLAIAIENPATEAEISSFRPGYPIDL